ncbi:DUF4124 domain-containing protein [Aromatoleum sp.]|uniref:DUF4124 domain-containing protein n=1 Tax=Aromatoleum sp. TaxID=2307007 RepID=UPI002FCCAFE3
MRRINLLVISLFLAAPACAEIYQWRDAQGQVHYSDTPPAGANARTLRETQRTANAPHPADAGAGNPAQGADKSGQISKDGAGKTAPEGGKASADSLKAKTLAEKEVEFRQRRAEAAEASAKAETERQQAAARQRDCERARNQLAALESGQRMARFNSSGEREVLNDAARGDEVARAHSFIASACK